MGLPSQYAMYGHISSIWARPLGKQGGPCGAAHACACCCLIRTLYDVFRNIADDEKEHVKTMKACRDYSIVDDLAKKKLTQREAMQSGAV